MAATTDADPDDRFALGDQAQINTLLKRMIDQRSLIDAAVPGNGPSLLTSILDGYFEALEPIFALIRECEDGRDVKALLKGPIAHSGFTRLN